MLKLFFLLCSLVFPRPGVAASSVDFLKRLVETSSPTENVDGVKRIQAMVRTELEALGFKVKMESPPANVRSADLLVATLDGTSPSFVTFVVHADTVHGDDFRGFKVSTDGSSAVGPGVVDNKGGIVVLIEALKAYLRQGKPAFSLRVVCSPNEEEGSTGFKARFAQLGRESSLVLGLEPALEGGGIISSRKGNRWYLVETVGREAHAGRAHAEGINACVELAGKMARLASFTNHGKGTTVSVGRLEGGLDKYNIVCGMARAKVDTRFTSFAERDRLHKGITAELSRSIVRAVSDGKAASTSFTIADESPPMAKEPAALPHLKRYLALLAEEDGHTVQDGASGGAADCNEFARPGLAILDGLGAVGGKMHTKEEHVLLASLQTRARVLAAFLDGLKL